MSTTVKKLLPPGPNTAAYPAGDTFNAQLAWDEGSAGAEAQHKNDIAALDWKNQFVNGWLYRLGTGNIPYDSVPPNPPVKLWALVTETTEDNGALTFDVEFVPGPTKELVCAIPPFTRPPAPSTGKNLMGMLSDEKATPGNPTITTVPVNSISTDSAGNQWVRIA